MSPAALALVTEEEELPAVAEEEAPEGYEFDEEFQSKIVALQLRDTVFATRTEGLIVPAYFENDTDKAIVGIALEFYRIYKKSPDWSTLSTLLKDLVAKKKIRADMLRAIVPRLNELKEVDISDRDYAVDQVADFAKNKAIENAMMIGIAALEKRDYATIQKKMQEALMVGAQDDIDYDYWKEIDTRTKERKDVIAGTIVKDGITTGVPDLDAVLYHGGWGRKELSCFMAAAKGGKSMALADFGQAASLDGKNVIYFTLEVAAKIIASRIDSNVADVAMKLVAGNPDKVEELIKRRMSKGVGAYQIREFATGSLTCSMIRRILQRYRAKGIIFDLIIVDYADIMAPEFRNEEERLNSKQVWEGLRAIAFEENAAVLTATQSNREGAKAVTAKGVNVAEDYNKVRTADVFMTINATDAERATGEARIFFSEMRNSESGFTLRIRQARDKMRFIEKVLGRE